MTRRTPTSRSKLRRQPLMFLTILDRVVLKFDSSYQSLFVLWLIQVEANRRDLFCHEGPRADNRPHWWDE